MTDNLTKDNIVLLAAKHYDSPRCIAAEFEDEINRVRHIKKLLTKYLNKNELNERLILNHLIIYANVFTVEFSVRMLFYFLEEKYHPALKTFLLYLGYLNDKIHMVNGKTYLVSDISVDMKIADALRKI